MHIQASQGALVVKNPADKAGDIRNADSIPASGRSPGWGHGNSLQCSCLENPKDRGAWRAAVQGSHRVRQDWSDLAHTHLWHIFSKFGKHCSVEVCYLDFGSLKYHFRVSHGHRKAKCGSSSWWMDETVPVTAGKWAERWPSVREDQWGGAKTRCPPWEKVFFWGYDNEGQSGREKHTEWKPHTCVIVYLNRGNDKTASQEQQLCGCKLWTILNSSWASSEIRGCRIRLVRH